MRERSSAGSRQVAAIESKDQSQDTLSVAQSHLHRVLATAQVGREPAWAKEVAQALAAARDAMRQHRNTVRAPDGLYAEIQFSAPWLDSRVKQMERQLDRVLQEASDLAEEVARTQEGESRATLGIRSDAERMLASLRDLMAKENDLVYQCLEEPPAVD